jgi:hypothetical protein
MIERPENQPEVDRSIWKQAEHEHAHAREFFGSSARREALWNALREKVGVDWQVMDPHAKGELLDKAMDSVYRYTSTEKYKGAFDKATPGEQNAMIEGVLNDKEVFSRIIQVVAGQHEPIERPLEFTAWVMQNQDMLKSMQVKEGGPEAKQLYDNYKKNWKPKKP